MPLPDDGFMKKAETCFMFWTINILSENIVVTDGPSVCLLQEYYRT